MRFQRLFQRSAVFVFVAICLLIQWPYIVAPLVGNHHDDGVLLVTARALAEGHGYVIESLPDPIAQTKYPILFPAVLALIWKFAPAFPDNLPWLRLVPLLCFWGWVYVAFRIVRDEFGKSEAAWWIAAVMLSCPLLVYYGTIPMSETMYSFISSLAIWLLLRISRREITWTDGVWVALAVAAAYHTRVVGIALVPVVAVVFLRKRTLLPFALFGVVLAALVTPWLIWISGQSVPADPVVGFYAKGRYADWNVLTGSTHYTQHWRDVIVQNVLVAVVSPIGIWGGKLPFVLLSLAALVGLFHGWHSRGRIIINLWCIISLGIMIVWPWPAWRFFLVLLPFALLTASMGVSPPSCITIYIARAFAFALIAVGLWVSGKNALATWHYGTPHYTTDESSRALSWTEASATFSWICENTPPDVRIAATSDPRYWLYCDRHAMRAFPLDPIQLFYVQDRTPFGDASALRNLLLRHHIDYLILERSLQWPETRPLMDQVAKLTASEANPLETVFTSPGGSVTVYRVRR